MSKKWPKAPGYNYDYNRDLQLEFEEERRREAAVRDEVLRQQRDERRKKAEKELNRFNSTKLTYNASYTNGGNTITLNPGALTAQVIAGQKDQPTGLKPLELLKHQVEEVRLEGRRALAA